MKYILTMIMLFVISISYTHTIYKSSLRYTEAIEEIINDNLRDINNKIELIDDRINNWYRQIITTQNETIKWVQESLSLLYSQYDDITPEYRWMDKSNWFYFSIWYWDCIKIQPYLKIISEHVECPIEYTNK